MTRHLRILLLLPLLALPACLSDPAPAAPTPIPPAATTTSATPPTLVPATDTPAAATPTAATATPALPTLIPASDTAAPAPSATAAPPTDRPATDTPVPPSAIPPTATPAPPAATATVPRATATVPPPAVTARSRAATLPTAATATRTTDHGPQITLLANGFGSPDDLTVDPRDGAIYFGDFTNTAVNRIDPAGGAPQPMIRGLREPEGIAVRADGQLVIVEQATNRIWLGNPQTGAKTLLRQLVNTSGQDGVDGIALDSDGSILVPDSPNGRLLAVSADGATQRVLASGFRRPTGVVRLPDGDLLVADEFGNALDRVTPAGHSSTVATLYQPDDVVLGLDGMAYVNTLDGKIYRIDPHSGAKTVLISGLRLPHGIGIDPQGRVVVAEATRNRIFRLEP